jgi:hypothetical protein
MFTAEIDGEDSNDFCLARDTEEDDGDIEDVPDAADADCREAFDSTIRLIYNRLESIAVPNTNHEKLISLTLAKATPITIGISDKYAHIERRECKKYTDKNAENKGSAALITCTKDTDPDVRAITVATLPNP